MQVVSGKYSSAIPPGRQGGQETLRAYDSISSGKETDKNVMENKGFNTSRNTKRKMSNYSDHTDHASVIYSASVNEAIASVNSDLTNRIAILSEKSIVHPNAQALKSIYLKILNLIHTSRTMQECLSSMHANFSIENATPTVTLLPLIFFEMLDYLIIKVMADDLLDLRYDIHITSKYVTRDDIITAWIGLMVRPLLYRDVCHCIRDGCIIDFNHSVLSGIKRSSSQLLYEQYFPEIIRKLQGKRTNATNDVVDAGAAQLDSDQVNVKVYVFGRLEYDTVTTMTLSFSDSIFSIKRLLECTDRIPASRENKMMCNDEELKDEVRLTDIRQHLTKNSTEVGFEFMYCVFST